MNKPNDNFFVTRSIVKVELPLKTHSRIMRAEQVFLRIGDKQHDIGALCYALRSNNRRKRGHPREVVTSSLVRQRPKHVLQVVKTLSSLITDGGKALTTTAAYTQYLVRFVDWADAEGLPDCLAGGDSTLNSFRAWVVHNWERYLRQEIGEKTYNVHVTNVGELLEAATGLENMMQGIRKLHQVSNPNGGTEPLSVHDFAHAVALNQSIFDGLCNLVIDQRPFPFKLELPDSLGWSQNHLWLFPTNFWQLPPHIREVADRAILGTGFSWVYDYEKGRLATIDEIAPKYKHGSPRRRRHDAARTLSRAETNLQDANTDSNHRWRYTLGMVAQRAFLFLFYCNTGANAQVAHDIETDGNIDATVQNQKFRSLKWRAGGKEVTLVAPATFMPRLRRFMELRRYLLQGRNAPYLFFSCGNRNNTPPSKIKHHVLDFHYRKLLTEIDPDLPKMGPRKLRASVEDYYRRHHDSVIAAAVMGHAIETGEKKYGRGSVNDHHEEISSFLASVSESARHQRVIPPKDESPNSPPLEEGGRCNAFGHPVGLAADVPVQPNCKDSQGCLFCRHRILVAGEEDVRKVASAAYVMEQLILGPRHEEALRPSIEKCDKDLEKIAAFPNCRAVVEKVLKDVYESENLTPFWADKYQLFLELGIIS